MSIYDTHLIFTEIYSVKDFKDCFFSKAQESNNTFLSLTLVDLDASSDTGFTSGKATNMKASGHSPHDGSLNKRLHEQSDRCEFP